MKRKSFGVMIVISLIIVVNFSFLSVATNSNKNPKNSFSDDDFSITSSENTEFGGVWFDDFQNLSMIDSYNDVELIDVGFSMNKIIFEDTFEEYSNGENIFNSASWTRHSTWSYGSFRGDTSKPHGADSDVIGYFRNDDLSNYAAGLTPSFSSSTGVFQAKVASGSIASSTGATTGMWLVGSTTNSPTNPDRIGSLSFNYGGLTLYNGGFNTINNSLDEDTWYIMEIDWDCGSDDLDGYVYDSDGELLGSSMNKSLENSFSTCRRIRLSTGRATSGGAMRSYWDDILIVNKRPSDSGEVISKTITIPTNMLWSTMKINKFEYPGTEVLISVLDSNSDPILGSLTNLNQSEIDLSDLNGLGHQSIQLKAELKPNGLRSPVLENWMVEWNSTDCWRDSFITSLKSSDIDNIQINNGTADIITEGSAAYIISEEINIPRDNYWDTLEIEINKSISTLFKVDVLNSTSNSPIIGFTDVNKSNIDLSQLNPISNPKIKIKLTISSLMGDDIYLNYWQINWTKNKIPIIGIIEGPENIFRNTSGHFSIDITDQNQGSKSLNVDFFVVDEGYNNHGEMISGIHFNETNSNWEVIVSPSNSSNVGMYEVGVKVIDEYNWIKENMSLIRINILNNNPSIPIIDLNPKYPTTSDDLIAEVLASNIDIETPFDQMKFTYEWYRNDILFRKIENTSDLSQSVSSMDTIKNEIWEIKIRSFDGLDFSSETSLSISIGNTQPFVNESNVELIVNEDELVGPINLTEYFYDLDNDLLIYNITMDRSIDHHILNHSELWISLPENWFGEFNVTIEAFDGQESNLTILSFEVLPVNDYPIINETPPIEIYEDEWYSIMFSAYDPADGDPITFSIDIDEIIPGLIHGENFHFYPNGSLILLPDNDMVGSYLVNITADDGNGGMTRKEISITIINVNDPPVIDQIDILYAIEDMWFKYTFNASDPFENDNVTLTIDVATKIPGLIEGVNFNFFQNGSFNLYPDNNMVGMYDINLTAIDQNGGIAFSNFTLVIKNVNDPPIGQINEPSGPIYIWEGENVTFNATASDIDRDDVVEIIWESLNGGIGDVIWRGSEFIYKFDEPGYFNVSCIISDGNIEMNIGIIEITVFEIIPPNNPPKELNIDIEPVIDGLDTDYGTDVMQNWQNSRSIPVNIPLQLSASAIDEDKDDLEFTWKLLEDDSWEMIGNQISIQPSSFVPGTYTFILSIDDGNGNYLNQTLDQIIFVEEYSIKDQEDEKNGIFIFILVLIFSLIVIITIISLIFVKRRGKKIDEESITDTVDIDNAELLLIDDTEGEPPVLDEIISDSIEQRKQDNTSNDEEKIANVMLDQGTTPDIENENPSVPPDLIDPPQDNVMNDDIQIKDIPDQMKTNEI